MPDYLPDPADLRWLVRSLDLRSFSAAAREMDVAVSVVTRGVDRLEAGYGVTLLRRSTHGLSPTAEGSELAQEARDVLARLDDISATLTRQRHRVSGTVRLASSHEICEQLVLPQLARLRELHPALRMELVADDRVADLVTDGIDVALRTTVGGSESVVARSLGTFERRLYASPAYLLEHGDPADPHELHQHRIITHTSQGPAATWAFRKSGKPLELTLRSQLAANTTALAHRAILAGAGIGMLSCPMASADLAGGNLVEVLAKFASRKKHTMFAVSLPSQRNAARVRAVVDFFQKAAGQWGLSGG